MTAICRTRDGREQDRISLPEDLLCDLDPDGRGRALREPLAGRQRRHLHQFLMEHKHERATTSWSHRRAVLQQLGCLGRQKQLATAVRYNRQVISSLHVHLMHNQTMEVILVQGPGVQAAADRRRDDSAARSCLRKMHLIAGAPFRSLHSFIPRQDKHKERAS